MNHITRRESWFEFWSISAKTVLEEKGKLSQQSYAVRPTYSQHQAQAAKA